VPQEGSAFESEIYFLWFGVKFFQLTKPTKTTTWLKKKTNGMRDVLKGCYDRGKDHPT
jgi:hypothetical protein